MNIARASGASAFSNPEHEGLEEEETQPISDCGDDRVSSCGEGDDQNQDGVDWLDDDELCGSFNRS